MSKKIDHLNDCLERMMQGEGLESCLKDYPEEAEELRLLLNEAGGVKRYTETIRLSPEFISRTQANLEAAYEARYYSWKARLFGILKPVGSFAATAAVVSAVLIFFFAGGVILSVLASEDTMPGQTLYPLKLATEEIRASFTFSTDRKTIYLTQFAEARAEEIAYAAERGDIAMVEAGLQKLESHLAEIEKIYSQDKTSGAIAAPDSRPPQLKKVEVGVQSSSARVEAKLKKIKEHDTEEKDKIIDRAEKAYSKALKAIQSAK